MDQKTWSTVVDAAIAREIKRRRAELGLSAEALGARCADLGYPLTRQVIAKLESGARSGPTPAELLILARALEMPPVSLILPLGQGPMTRPTPLSESTPWEAVAWFTGEDRAALPETPEAGSPQAILDAFRRHDRLVRTALLSTRMAAERRRDAQLAPPDDYERTDTAAAQLEQVAQADRSDLLAARRALRDQSLFPPPLPADLAHIDREQA
ncbi:helix-turn-helix transcriptional regulator [Kitasatospora sp. NPDC058048]|uniref:helix-turn-helix transcriptional regulator n=1 Tax=Kitasatospora sp. NPDC058048 TaxID=3346313 RepID=UPI0036DE56BC